NAAVNSVLFTVLATDEDSGLAGSVKYNIDEVIPSDGATLFIINDRDGRVSLIQSLNYTYLSTFYRLKISATDGGGPTYTGPKVLSSATFAFITVVDVADLNPRFLALPYRGSVEENTLVGHVVLTVTAIDQDSGLNYAILYSIETEAQLNIHGLQAFATTDVQISITDINDNAPLFYSCEPTCVQESQFRGEIFENSAGTIQIGMTVKDLDLNGQIQLKVEGIDKDAFSVIPSVTTSESNVQLVVIDPQLVDFETKEEMVVQVIATDMEDNTLTSIATVTIKVLDINDNSPIFPEVTYELEVVEHSAAGTVVARITATDLDKIDQGKLTYSLLPESIRKYFNVEPETGTVYVTDSDLIDREVSPLYSATLQARDTANKTGTTVLEIHLKDINDKAPFINRESYMGFVKEGQPFELQIQATDADDPNTENSQIVYGIVHSAYSDNFTIDANTGLLKNRGPLDREALDRDMEGKIVLNVTATDKGTPALMTTVEVIVNIEATDLDQAIDFNRITFSIREGSFGNFLIRTSADGASYRGNITVDPDVELDYESAHKHFTLLVEAADLSQSTATVSVKVTVVDVNDERPEFGPSGPLSAPENSTVTAPLGSFKATDKDENHSLVYHMVSCECRCNASFKPCDWMLLDSRGEVSVNPAAVLDYELCDQVRIEAQVVDELTEKGENNSVSTGVMVVDIVDINDNAPEFIKSDTIFVLLSETANKGTSVAGVTATDRDTGQYKVINFKVSEVKYENTDSVIETFRTTFEAVTTQQKDRYVGIIQDVSTLMDAYFVNGNGTGITSASVEKMLSDPDHYFILDHYRTKLKAAKAMRSTTMVTTDNQRGGPVVPGTNKYTMEGANPVLNLNIDTVTDLGFDEDAISVRSLDDSMSLQSEKDGTMMEEEEEEDDDSVHIEPLGAALAQRANKQTKKDAVSSEMGFTNPAFSITEL
ncbi:hypothetical protein CRUP_031533, partial [Coryphaenoides rupestris]